MPPVKAKEGAPTKEEIMGKEKVLPKTSAPEDNVAKEKRSVAPTLKERIAALQASSSGGVFSDDKKVVRSNVVRSNVVRSNVVRSNVVRSNVVT